MKYSSTVTLKTCMQHLAFCSQDSRLSRGPSLPESQPQARSPAFCLHGLPLCPLYLPFQVLQALVMIIDENCDT